MQKKEASALKVFLLRLTLLFKLLGYVVRIYDLLLVFFYHASIKNIIINFIFKSIQAWIYDLSGANITYYTINDYFKLTSTLFFIRLICICLCCICPMYFFSFKQNIVEISLMATTSIIMTHSNCFGKIFSSTPPLPKKCLAVSYIW